MWNTEKLFTRITFNWAAHIMSKELENTCVPPSHSCILAIVSYGANSSQLIASCFRPVNILSFKLNRMEPALITDVITCTKEMSWRRLGQQHLTNLRPIALQTDAMHEKVMRYYSLASAILMNKKYHNGNGLLDVTAKAVPLRSPSNFCIERWVCSHIW